MDYNFEYDWENLFTEEQLEEAQEYYVLGKAKKLTDEPYGFSATVRGHRNYRVRIFEGEYGIFDMECTCGLSSGETVCKHMAAALMLIEDTYEYSPFLSPVYARHMLPPVESGAFSGSRSSAPETGRNGRSAASNGTGKNAGPGPAANPEAATNARTSANPGSAANARTSANSGSAANQRSSAPATSASHSGPTKNTDPAASARTSAPTSPAGKNAAGKKAAGKKAAGKKADSRRDSLSRLTALKLRDRQEREHETGETDEGLAALDTYRFFDADAIEKGMQLSRNQIQAAERFRAQGDIGSTQITTGDNLITISDRQIPLRSTNPQNARQVKFVQNSKSRTWRVEQYFSRSEMLSSKCSCWDCAFSRRTARNSVGHMLTTHEAAAFRIALQYMREHSVGDITSFAAGRFLDAYRGTADAENAAPVGEILTIRPCLWEDTRGNWLIRFQTGSGRLYMIKNIPEYLQDVRSHKSRQYGKNTILQFGQELLDEKARIWTRFMEKALGLLRSFAGDTPTDTPYYYTAMEGWQELQDRIPLYGHIMDMFFDTLLEQGDRIELTRKSPDHWERGNDKLSVRMSEEGTAGLQLTLEPVLSQNGDTFDGLRLYGNIPRMLHGGDHDYLFKEDGKKGTLLRADPETAGKLRPLMDAGSRDGTLELFIGRMTIADFYRKALPQLREIAEITEIRPELVQKYIPVEPEFVCYLDVDQDVVLCEPAVYYGDKVHSPFDSEKWKNRIAQAEHYRDINAEHALMDFLTDVMAEKDDIDKIFLTPRDDEALYAFLDSGLSRLMTMSEVKATERFMRLKIRRRMPFHAGLSMTEGLLNMELISDELSPDEILQAVSGYRESKKFIRLKNGDFLRIEENEELLKLVELMDTLQVSPKELLAGRMHIPAFRSLYIDKMMESMEDVYVERDSRFKKLIKEFKTISDADFDVPAGLRQILRKYQVVGYRWMRMLDAYGFGGILADDMGLGKTLQAIAVLLTEQVEIDPERDPGTSLVVCPASLIYNWEEELHKYASILRVQVVAGTRNERREMLARYRQYDVLVTSYDLLKRDIAEYEGLSFRYEFIDEAQYIKNHRTEAAKCVKLITAQTRFALTGTPIENRLSELWSIFDYVMPGFLYDYTTFREEFETAIVKNHDEERMEQLRRMVGPFILRRAKSEVLRDLPEKLEEVHYAGFGKSSEQRKLYDAQVVRMREDLRSKSEEELRHSRIEILAELTRIRQICCDPALLYENYKGDSVKKEMCMELVRSVVSGEHKALIFSQFTRMLELLKAELDKEKIPYYEITGATPKEARMERVRAFNADRTPVFLISLKAGGTGLNLTGADVVIHYDPWWNVAVQNQATDRAHRIGQTKVVTVYQLILKGSIEEKIMEMQQQKKALAEDILSSESVSASSFSREELLALLEG